MSDLREVNISMPLSIVPFDSRHYPALANLLTEIYSDHYFDPEGLQSHDDSVAGDCKFQRWIGLVGDTIVAFGEYRQTPEMYDPNRFILNMAVHKNYRCRGIGRQIYAHVVSELNAFQPTVLRATVRADSPHSVAFLEKRNYVCTLRLCEWHLELEKAEVSDSAAKIGMEQTAGFTVRTVEDLRTDPRRDRKLYELISLLREDVPMPERPTKTDFTQFVTGFLADPSYDPEAAFVAVQAGEYIGYSDLRDDGAGSLYGGLTGVRREYRRQGIGTALKLQGIHYGRSQGCQWFKTFSAGENVSIGRINRKFGFVPKFEWMHFEQLCSQYSQGAAAASRT